MEKEKQEAFVIKSVKYGEHDKMLTLFTKDDGKISAVAKGALSTKSKYMASAQLFCLSEYVLTTSSGMPYVSTAEVIRGFYGLNKDIERLCGASYCMELVDAIYEDKMAEPVTFRLIYFTQQLLEEIKPESVYLIVLAFVLKLCGINGIAPILNACCSCMERKASYFLDYDAGGLVCSECKDSSLLMPKLSAKEAELMYAILHIDMTKLSGIIDPDKQTVKYLLKVMNDYIKYNFPRKLKSFDLLYSL